MNNCIFVNAKCKALENQQLAKLYETDIQKYILQVCSMCVKNRYARAKERLSKKILKTYSIVNTL